MPKKSFVKGRKQELEILMMYYWIHSIDGDEEDYWQKHEMYGLSVILTVQKDVPAILQHLS